jgi:hypothetical protein
MMTANKDKGGEFFTRHADGSISDAELHVVLRRCVEVDMPLDMHFAVDPPADGT